MIDNGCAGKEIGVLSAVPVGFIMGVWCNASISTWFVGRGLARLDLGQQWRFLQPLRCPSVMEVRQKNHEMELRQNNHESVSQQEGNRDLRYSQAPSLGPRSHAQPHSRTSYSAARRSCADPIE